MIPEDSNIDPHISPAEMLHILDSDSSQGLTVHEVRHGRDMVSRGRPERARVKRSAMTAGIWDNEVERAADVAEAIADLESARASINAGLTEAAWAMDMSATRATLAAHGSGFFRLFSGEWRRANRIAGPVLTRPKAPLEETLAVFDAPARGRAALTVVKDEDVFARTAFGRDWRGEQSTSEPLMRLFDWIRSSKIIGPAPREIAARRAAGRPSAAQPGGLR